MNDTREFAPVCNSCGAEHNGPSFVGQCTRCYADALAHGGEFSSVTAIVRFMKDVLSDGTKMRDAGTIGTPADLNATYQRAIKEVCAGYGLVRS